jgi:hypothetical protein
MRRFWKLPPEIVNEFERLIRDTDLPARECARQSGMGEYVHIDIVHKYRRYIGNGRWVDRLTGKVRPELCTMACAVKKTGLSARSIRRRIKSGVIEPNHPTSHKYIYAFDEHTIEEIKALGRNPSTSWSVLSVDDVNEIRDRAAQGETHVSIAKDFPVSRRQISRIINGTRWKP